VTGTYVRRRSVQPPNGHKEWCDMPPPVDGRGALYRCGCRRLWRLGYACGQCDWADGRWGHGGMCTVGEKGRPATTWQRIRYWRLR
jgi:hypothetical protein